MKSEQSNKTAIAIIAGLFFIFGFITWVNGALIPFMKTINELTEAQSYFVASASYISFVVMALPASYLLRKIGYRKGMSIGLFLMAVGALVFIPAADARTYWIFLAGIFIQGTGMTVLQTAANPYITILGPIESGAKRIAIMGIANKVAGALGSVIFGAILLNGIDEVKDVISQVSAEEKAILLDQMADSVFMPYLIMAIVLFVLGLLMRRAPLPDVEAEANSEEETQSGGKKTIFQYPHLWFGMLTLFVYVGAEVIAGDTIIAYGLALGISASKAKFFTNILEHKDIVISNYKLMQLYAPAISLQSQEKVHYALNNFEHDYNKTEILRMMNQDGFGVFNWEDLHGTMNKICIDKALVTE